jgi:transcriptional regulator of arginine metabolism
VHAKARRQSAIRELLDRHRIPDQAALRSSLASAGIRATQATLSRDLREMGVVKGPSGYRLAPPAEAVAPPSPRELERALKSYLISGRPAGAILVLRTGPGHANPLAVELDRSKMPECVGTVAGDDTVFVATPAPRAAARLLSRLQAIAGRKP